MTTKFAASLLVCLACLQGSAALAQDTSLPTLSGPLLRPQYPIEAKRYGLEGLSLVGALISETGMVTRVELLKSSGFNLLDAEAMRVVRQAKFSPAMSGGVAKSSWVRAPIRFQLEGPPANVVPSDAVLLGAEQQSTATAVAISLTRDGLMYLGSEPVGLEDLRARLVGLSAKQRLSIHIRADEDALYGRVARVIAAAQSAGVADIRFMVVKPD